MAEPARSIVALEAHPDDVELGCLGTLAAYRAQRPETSITIAALTLGDRGSAVDPTKTPDDISQEREREATSVATALEADFRFLGQKDCFTDDAPDAAGTEAFVRLLREVRADLVLAPPPADYHRDHMVASRIAEHACMLATVPTLFRDATPLTQSPQLLYMDPITGLGADPSVYIDITEVFERKCELLRLHASQMASMQKWGGWDLVEYGEIMGRYRGLQSGVAYAEAFTPSRAWPRLRTEARLP